LQKCEFSFICSEVYEQIKVGNYNVGLKWRICDPPVSNSVQITGLGTQVMFYNIFSAGSRVLFATWWIFVQVLTSFYTAELTAFLTLVHILHFNRVLTKKSILLGMLIYLFGINNILYNSADIYACNFV